MKPHRVRRKPRILGIESTITMRDVAVTSPRITRRRRTRRRATMLALSTRAPAGGAAISSARGGKRATRGARRCAANAVAASAETKKPTTVEHQRERAKMMVRYFKEKQYDQAVEDAQVFGFTPSNEINNGRWTMFGLLVGMLTEFATGVDFIDQIKLTVSVLGIADIYD